MTFMSFIVHSWHFEYLRVFIVDDRLLGERRIVKDLKEGFLV